MASSKETYCLCGQPYNIGQFMIECDCCREWFHGSCVDVKIYQSDDIDKYHCPKCSQTYGPSVLKIPTNNHRADRYELCAEQRPLQTGSPAWVRALAARPPRPTAQALQTMLPQQFTEEFVRDNGFTRPILFPTPEGLDIRTPKAATFTARSVLRYCGAQLEVEVIDVRKQATLRMPLGEFVEYMESPPARRHGRALNVVSLEFSDTNMSSLVDPPLLARRLDWAGQVWPADQPPRPAVQKYCLMSAEGSYTDFHVDFGGTTVWYHVMHGSKIFYLIPPTATNLALYQQWSASTNHGEKFFGDMVEWYGTAELSPGQTLFIPSGWIHAVLTPVDSLVFGGNLLHSYAIETQLQIYEIERRVETPLAFRYPLFEAMHWYAGAHLLSILQRYNEESQDVEFTLGGSGVGSVPLLPPLLLRGIRILATALKEWHQLKSSDTAKRDNVPKCINSGQLVRELCKELRTLEKRTAATRDRDFKPSSKASPKKAASKPQAAQKKSLKLTLPKPIMHMTPNGEFQEEKVYADRLFIDNKEVIYPDHRFNNQVVNGLPEAKYVVEKEPVLEEKYAYQNYEEMQNYNDNGYVERQDKKGNVLRIKLHQPLDPPPYPLEQSILKSHLVRGAAPRQQWTISKKDIGDYQEQVLFTNENVSVPPRVEEMSYGPGMYSAEDMSPYAVEAKPSLQYYPPAPSYHYPEHHQLAEHHQHQPPQTEFTVLTPDGATGVVYGAPPHEIYRTDVPLEHEPPPAPLTPVRRSERPVRRRVSSSYDYEDGDLYIDDTPLPRRRAKPKIKHKVGGGALPFGAGVGAAGPALVPANGIESLIQASVLAEGEPPPEHYEDAAVAGMLSIADHSRTFGSGARGGGAGRLPGAHNVPGAAHSVPGASRSPGRRAAPEPEPESDEDVIKEVHRDEEYVYPSLEMSSEDEDEWPPARRKGRARDTRTRDKDESWSPRARLGRLVPRLRAPGRASRRECVRKALTAARDRERDRERPAPEQPSQHPPSVKRQVLQAKIRRPPPPPPPPPTKQNTRLKKGMKTAKQRLGKILKIHKMIY